MADPTSDPRRRRRKLAAILMADVSGFSRLMGVNEDATVGLIREFHESVRTIVEEFEGRIVDTAGDSVFSEFDSVVNAVRCARRIQAEQAARNGSRLQADRLEARIGVHLGDVIVEDYRVYGDGVNIAARLEPLADPGGICISEAVYQQVRGKIELPVEDLGVCELKNIDHPIRLYKVPPVERPDRSTAEAPARTEPSPSPASTRSLEDDFAHVDVLVPAIVALFLLVSPVVLFSTAGVFPTLGSVLLALTLGRVWARRCGRVRNLLIALGAGIASGALWTQWGGVTDTLFVLAGLIVAAIGMAGRREP